MMPKVGWLDDDDGAALAGTPWLDWLCVPVIVASLVGMLWSLPVPDVFAAASPVLNWGTLFLMAAVVYYFIASIALAFGLLPFVMLVATLVLWLDALPVPLRSVCGPAFLGAWSLQLFGRWRSGKRLRPFTNLQHVMLAPLRLLAGVYRRLQIPY